MTCNFRETNAHLGKLKGKRESDEWRGWGETVEAGLRWRGTTLLKQGVNESSGLTLLGLGRVVKKANCSFVLSHTNFRACWPRFALPQSTALKHTRSKSKSTRATVTRLL